MSNRYPMEGAAGDWAAARSGQEWSEPPTPEGPHNPDDDCAAPYEYEPFRWWLFPVVLVLLFVVMR